MDPLDVFSPQTRGWFERAFEAPTPAQELGWPAIATGGHVLIQAPTGSGKTLAAFLSAIDRLTATPGEGLRVLYVSPLKALNYDIERNLRGPLAGLQSALRVGVRTGDTPAKERRELLKEPPDILITTPESLYLMLTSAARETLRGVETLIIDEVHAVAGTKRGAHLALSVERLERLTDRRAAADRPLGDAASARRDRPVRLGRPADRARRRGNAQRARPAGGRPRRGSARARVDRCALSPGRDQRRCERRRERRGARLDLALDVPGAARARRGAPLDDRLRQQPPPGRAAGAAAERARGARGRARASRSASPASSACSIEEDLKAGRIPVPRRDLVARARDRHGRGRPRDPGRVAEVGRARPAADRPRRPRARRRLEGPHLPEVPRRPARVARSSPRAMRAGEIEETQIPRNPLDVLAQQIVAICCRRGDRGRRAPRPRAAARTPSPSSRAPQLENVLDMLAGRYPSDEFAELRPRIVWDRTGGTIRAREGARRLAVTNAGTIPDRGLFGVFLVERRRPGRRARRGDGLRGAGRARRSCSAPRPGGSRRSRATACSSRPAPGAARRGAVLEGRGRRPPVRARRRRSARPRASSAALGRRRRARAAARRVPARRARRPQPARVPARPGRRDRRRALRSNRRRRALPRRDRRLARLHPHAVRRPRPCAVGDGDHRAAAGVARARGAVDLVGRRDRAPLPRRRRAAAAPPSCCVDPAEVEDLVVAELGETALFGARFRENAARVAADPAPPPGPAYAALAAAPEGAVAAAGRARVRLVPGRARDLSRVSPGRLRPARAARAAEGDPDPRARLVEVETRQRVAVSARRCSSTTSRPTCTRTTRRRPSAGRRRSRSTATCSRELLGQEELRDLLDADAVDEVERQLRGEPTHAPTSSTTSCACAATCAAGRVRPGARRAAASTSGALSSCGSRGEERLIAAEDAGRYRDALGVMPPGGPPGVVSRRRPGLASPARAPLREGPRAVHERPRPTSGSARDVDRRCSSSSSATELLVRGELRPGRNRARVVRPRRAAAAAARVACRAAARGRAGRARRRWRASCPPGTGSAGARPCARRSCRCRRWRCRLRSGRASCCRGASPATGPSSSTRSVRAARSSGSGAGMDRVALYFREDAAALGQVGAAPGAGGSSCTTASRAALGAGALFWFDLLEETGARRRRGAPGALGSRLGGRGHERRLDAPSRRPSLRRAEARAPSAALLARAGDGRHRDAGALVADGASLRRARRIDARSPSSCSSARESSRATACAPRGFRAATAPSTRSCARSRRWGSAGAATSSRVSAARSSRSAARSSGCASCGSAARSRRLRCWPPPIRRSPTALRCRGRSARARALPASPGLTSCCSVARRCSTSSVAAARLSRCVIPTRPGCARPSRRSSGTYAAAGAKRLAVERFDSEPVTESDVMPLLVEAGFLAGPRRAVLRP